MMPEVMQAVTGKSFTSSAGILPNYVRRRLKGRVYPGVVRCAHRFANGRVYHGVDRHALALLDTFEGDEFRRIRVNVAIVGGKHTIAYAYVIRPCYARLLMKTDWGMEWFVEKDLKLYLQRLGNRKWDMDYREKN